MLMHLLKTKKFWISIVENVRCLTLHFFPLLWPVYVHAHISRSCRGAFPSPSVLPLAEPQNPRDSLPQRASTDSARELFATFLDSGVGGDSIPVFLLNPGSGVCQGASRSMCEAAAQRASHLMCQWKNKKQFRMKTKRKWRRAATQD